MDLQQISAQQLDGFLEEKKNLVVVFSKESCSVCKQLAPIMEKVAHEYENDTTVNFYSMDVKTEDGLAKFKELQLVGVPQSVFFSEGAFNEALPGAINETIIRKEINAILGIEEENKGFFGKLKGLFGK